MSVTFIDDGTWITTVEFSGGDLTAEGVQASLNEALGTGRVIVGTGSRPKAATSEPRPVVATEDYKGWSKADLETICGGGDPSRLRRFHAGGCRWLPKERQWDCAADCNVPDWRAQEAAEDD